MADVKEHYNGRPMAANSATQATGSIAGFYAAVAGTMTITDADGTVIMNAGVIAAGWNRIPLLFHSSGLTTIQLAGGAAGTLFY